METLLVPRQSFFFFNVWMLEDLFGCLFRCWILDVGRFFGFCLLSFLKNRKSPKSDLFQLFGWQRSGCGPSPPGSAIPASGGFLHCGASSGFN